MTDDPEDLPKPPGGLFGPGPFAYLAVRPGSTGQSKAWQKREADRRAGRGRKDWWKHPPRPLDRSGVSNASAVIGEDQALADPSPVSQA